MLTIQKLYIDGTGQTIYDENTRLQLWNYIPNKQSVNDVKDAMKTNLGQKEHEVREKMMSKIDRILFDLERWI